MTGKHIITGILGETVACNYLEKKGYIVIEKNWRYKHLEIDLIAKDGPILIFIEVKTRSSAVFGLPYESVNLRKQRRLDRAANIYIAKHNHEGEVRFDVLSILINKGEKPNIRHIKDAFWPEA